MTMTIGGTSGLVFPDSSTQNTGASGFGFKNRIINGAMMIDQRNAGASFTPTTTTYYGTCDRWAFYVSQNSKLTAQQSSTAPTGFKNSLIVTSSSAYSITSGDYFTISQAIEGFNVADLDWGTANAKTVTLSFWVRSSLTGTFGGTVQNSAQNRSYPFSYTISSANTWEQKSITIAGDTTGTWLTNNGIGIGLQFGLGVGSSNSGTAGAWAGSNFLSSTGATSVVGTNGATFYITGVQLEKGSTATSFDYRPYGTELALCQRYFQVLMSGQFCDAYMAVVRSASGTVISMPFTYQIPMRASPTIPAITVTNLRVNGRYGDTGLTSGTVSFADITPRGSLLNVSSPAASGWTFNLGEALYVNTQTTATNLLTVSAEL